ncbi:4919_t:CDS:1 [Scutellospora calospora]|uniref:4919_t:CDS:1 n=1 Tax=Scutellospora calospora TaxID=85575 RepID=A0ACA9LPV6_9GLOM|nr:4919_t:CDS:1 [Scutellospora calospora]
MSTKKENSVTCINECQDLNKEATSPNKNSDTIIPPSTNQDQPSSQNVQIPLKPTTFPICCSEGNSPTSAPCESAYFDVYGISSISSTSNSCSIKSAIEKLDNI